MEIPSTENSKEYLSTVMEELNADIGTLSSKKEDTINASYDEYKKSFDVRCDELILKKINNTTTTEVLSQNIKLGEKTFVSSKNENEIFISNAEKHINAVEIEIINGHVKILVSNLIKTYKDHENSREICKIIDACCDEDLDVLNGHCAHSSVIFSYLFENNNECIKFLHSLMVIAINKKSISIIEWFDKNNYNFGNNFVNFVDIAIKNKCQIMLKWFEKNKPTLFKNIDGKHLSSVTSLNIIVWLEVCGYEKLISIDDVLLYASANNLIDIIDYYKSKINQRFISTDMIGIA